MPNIKFDKQTGREEEKFDTEDAFAQPELLLEPNIDVIRKRKQFLVVNFDKQIGREEKKHVDDEEVYVNNLEYDEPRAKDPAERKIVAHDFGKQEERFKSNQMLIDSDLVADELIIETKLPERKIKGFVNMDKDKVERFPIKINKDPFYDDQPITDMHIGKSLMIPKERKSIMHFRMKLT